MILDKTKNRYEKLKKYSTESFLSKLLSLYGNKYNFSKVIYNNAKSNIIVICPTHGEFLIKPMYLLKGQECKYCSYNKNRKTQEEFLFKVKEIFKDKYDFKQSLYIGSKKKVKVICKYHGEFFITPSKLYIGQGCSECGRNYSHEEYIEKCLQIYGDRFDYSETKYKDSKTEISFKCKRGHVLYRNAYTHLKNKTTCFQCRNFDEFVKRVKIIHGDKYIFNETGYINEYTSTQINCPKHGWFKVKPKNFLRNSGCKQCENDRILNNFIERSRELYGDEFDYSFAKYISYNKPIILKCKNGHFLKRAPNDHLPAYRGCSDCLRHEAEKQIEKFLINNQIIFQSQKRFKECRAKLPLPFDFYLPEYNTCIEYDGCQHFFPIYGKDELNGVIYRDKIKTNFCLENGISLIRIRGRETINNVLTNLIYPISI